MLVAKVRFNAIALIGCAAFSCALVWQGLYSVQLCRLFTFDADQEKLASLTAGSPGDMVELSKDGGMAVSRNGWLPSGDYYRPALSGGLLPYHAARRFGWLVDPPDGAAAPRHPVPNSLEPGSPTIPTAVQQFGIVMLLGGLLTAATAALTIVFATSLFNRDLAPPRPYRRVIVRSALRRAAIAVPSLTLLLAYASYDRGVFYGPPVPNFGTGLALTFFSLGFGALLGTRIGRRVRLSNQKRLGNCANCGYNLGGLQSPRCPECGNVLAESRDGKPHVNRRPQLLVAGYVLSLSIVIIWTPLTVVSASGTMPSAEGAGVFLLRWVLLRVTNDKLTGDRVYFMLPNTKVFRGLSPE